MKGHTMSTRAILTFKDFEDAPLHVYQHCDGYPTGIAENLKAVLSGGKAWPFPRFEADEFAAAYVATCKTSGGNIRLARTRRAAGDVAFGYTVYVKDGERTPRLTVSAIDGWDTWKETRLWDGPLTHFTPPVAATLGCG
jgi:hypothetical protein